MTVDKDNFDFGDVKLGQTVQVSFEVANTGDAPLACADGVKDTWREVAKHTADQLIARFGDSVRVQYFDLFDADCPALPDGAQLPLVLIAGEVLSGGGKISTPAIRKRVEAFGVTPNGH